MLAARQAMSAEGDVMEQLASRGLWQHRQDAVGTTSLMRLEPNRAREASARWQREQQTKARDWKLARREPFRGGGTLPKP
jgi:hypothetical protein